ncbi:cytochrome o ubiquinol oxidase subunit IV [Paracoccus methylarcula]|uniref:Cytochrome bo(3) ubiquinol oxidase subunit 4 n=1 Tax=Paracoccus methylarcula TaxID=72022 RepID=A0A3R7NZB4_9RHOB|nr:cytochrome o ubiquinol oxidase subunit IV [Paracoccus methylarcula]RNF36008.1 cytochrome o ubiquinol oxidase subunit IV [Paracoccus methylarcula]
MSAHTHYDNNHDHGSYRGYITGFLLSVVLTAIPFGLVMAGGFESHLLTVGMVVGCAIVQVLVHMVYFLHMNSRAEEGWTLLSTLFTVIIVVIMIAGSLWVMYHLNTNMMPQMNHDLLPEQLR